MNEYTPDGWQILRIKYEDEVIHKVLADWGGGYLHGASWKLSSGVTKIEETPDEYTITNFSGSVYHCRKTGQQLHMIGLGMLANFQKELGEAVTLCTAEEAKAEIESSGGL